MIFEKLLANGPLGDWKGGPTFWNNLKLLFHPPPPQIKPLYYKRGKILEKERALAPLTDWAEGFVSAFLVAGDPGAYQSSTVSLGLCEHQN